MKKRDVKKQDNLILFPDVDQRLLEKGLEAIQNKKYQEAISFLENANSLNDENGETKVGLIVAYFELGKLQEAKRIAKTMLEEGIGDYIHVLDLYIMILVQLHEYEEIVTTIQVLLEDGYIPASKIEHFSKMLDFSRRMAVSNESVDDSFLDKIEPMDKELRLMEIQDPKEQMILISQLTNQNIRFYINEVKEYLESETGSPFFKTMLLNILKEQEYDKDIKILKFDREAVVVPSTLEDIHSRSQLNEIIMLLREKLEHDDPVLLESIQVLVERQLFILYPFELPIYNGRTWAAAYHSAVNGYYGAADDPVDFSLIYGVIDTEIEDAKEQINRLEEISYPNI